MENFVNYLRETKAELSNVKWPTRKQAVIYTVLVIAISGLVSLFLGAFDFVFTTALNWFLAA